MFEKHFGLSANPFTIAPNPNYLYLSDQHREALAHLQYGLHENGGFILLTGEVGTGKTTIWRCLAERLSDEVELAVLLNPCLSARELLEAICDEFKIEYDRNSGSKRLTDALNHYLLVCHQHGKRCVLIAEEAQNLSDELLEQLRMLTNLETNEKKLLQIVLIGQPELVEKLEQPHLRQLRQRIIASFHLQPLDADEIKTYVEHRLATAGSVANLFSRDALLRLAKLSGGVPRLINLICERALLGCFSEGRRQVNLKILETAAHEVLGKRRRLFARFAKKRLSRPASPQGTRSNSVAWVARASALAAISVLLAGGTIFLLPSIEQAGTRWANEQGTQAVADNPVAGIDKEVMGWEPDGDADKAEPQQPAVVLTGLDKLEADSLEHNPYTVLFGLWGVEFSDVAEQLPCQFSLKYRLDCWHRRGEINGIKRVNRPAILKLLSSQGKPFYATLTKITAAGALKVNAGGGDIELTEKELVTAWTGEYTLLWRRPSDYRDTLYPGDKSNTVRWIANSLANVSGKQSPVSSSRVYTAALQNQIRSFQGRCGLFVDGLVGKETLIKLNTLLDPMPQLAPLSKSCRGRVG